MAVKPGTPHPTKKGLVMGKNGSYVSKTTYAKQVKAAQTSTAKPEKGGALVKQGSSAITKTNSKPASKPASKPTTSQKALPPGKKGGALTKGGVPTGRVNVKGAVGNVALAALAAYVADKANKAADPETWKKKSEELRAARAKPKPVVKGAGGGQGNRDRNRTAPTKRPVANLPSDYKKTEAAAFKAAEKPKPARQNSSGSSSGGSRPASKPKGQSKDMGENYRRWAAANPELAKKVKKGQAGYKELNPSKPAAASKPKPKPKQDAAASRVSETRQATSSKSKAKPQQFESLSEKRKRKYNR